MSLLIENLTLLRGTEFEVVRNGWLRIEDGMISDIGESIPSRRSSKTAKAKNLIAIPGLVDAHIHLGDAIARDIGTGSTLKELVHPIHGLKSQILRKTPETALRRAIGQTLLSMLASGITAFADFREGGSNGVKLIRNLLTIPHRGLILGRPDYSFPENRIESTENLPDNVIKDLKTTLKISDGLGISGPNEYTDSALDTIAELSRLHRKSVAIHAAESTVSKEFSLAHFGETEVKRTLTHIQPKFVVHLTNAAREDLDMIAKMDIPIVCCPQANAALGLGVPPIIEMLERGITVALGTDNVMINEPDMFREMNFASKMLKAKHRNPSVIAAKDILRMVTQNAAKALGLKKMGSLEIGMKADIVFLNLNHANLRFSHDLVASVVHRARRDNIACVMAGGEILHGSLKVQN
jgi:cytosine/adenosine deaminase-related metal-dependent hydrolase